MSLELSKTFDELAHLYNAVRPGYPDALVATVASVLPEGGKILEIGCGTGQATIPFARRGFSILALEPGLRLASLAAENLKTFPAVTIETMIFEDWPIREGQFDMVMSATAFHWVAPEVRYVKAAQALKDSGQIALF